ncbi:MAG: RIP metalloprotease RseP [Dehalococcoidia bacterium]|nr:RIP metalloprotease RseP [Dehalococcoidia bacterium]
MSIFISILIFLAILMVVILVHELGHFITAKRSKVKVEELGLGFPPRLLSFKRGETIYSLNLIPLGGFCRMAGEEDPDVPGSLAGKSVKTRLLVLSAGSLFMLLFPLLLLPLAYMIPMARPVEDGGVRVESVAESSPAELAGIETGDIIMSIDGQEVKTFDDIQNEIDRALDTKPGEEVTLLLLRDDDLLEKTLIPRTKEETPEGEGPIGIGMGPVRETSAYPPWEAIPKGLGDYGRLWVAAKDALASLIAGEVPLKDAVAGPIGIAQMTSEVAALGAEPLIRLAALISVSLAIVNLLPIPGLDGGRIVFVAIEGIRRGKRISAKKEGLIHLIGFALLLMLIVLVSYNDVMRLIKGEGFIQ